MVSNITWEIWWILTQPLKSLQISLRLILSKVIRLELKKIQRSYLSWHWTMMQNLNKPWPWGFINGVRNWLNFHYSTYNSEKLYIDGQKVVQSIYYLSLKISEESCDITLKGFAKFKGKPTRGLKNDTRNLVNFYASSRKFALWWVSFVQSI